MRVFISYRRRESRYEARDIFRKLSELLPADNVFYDSDSIPLGDDFDDRIRTRLSGSDIVIVLIGPDWLDTPDTMTGQRRLDDPRDYVRLEVGEALRLGKQVAPVLIDGTQMPREDSLPSELRALSSRQAEHIAFRTAEIDIDNLVRRLGVVKRCSSAKWSPDQRIDLDAPVVSGSPDHRFTPGYGRVEWFQDTTLTPRMVIVPKEPLNPNGEPFAIGRAAVSFDEWDACTRVGGVDHRPNDAEHRRGARPVVNVSARDAERFLEWLSALTGAPYRLPTEREWEHAARAGAATPYWWGHADDAPDDEKKAMGRETTIGFTPGVLAPAHSGEANKWGLLRVHGNVWELCSNDGGQPTDDRAIRGGSYLDLIDDATASSSARVNIGARRDNIGFRVVRDLFF